MNVTKRLLEITEKFGIEWPRKESVYLVGMLHDLVKTETYRVVDERGTTAARPENDGMVKYEYMQPVYGGHGSASATLVMANLGVRLYPVEAAAITWHMGAYGLDRDGLKAYDRALEEFFYQIIATHTADVIAAKVDEKGR